MPQAVKPMPLPTPVPSSVPEEKTDAKPRPAIFETTVMRTIPEPAAQAGTRETIQAAGVQTSAPRSMPNGSAWLDPLRSPVLQDELPGLPTAFDGEAMREYLQLALFGKSHTQYRIERCAPGKAIYMGDTCALRYELVVKETSSGQTFQPLVVGRIFQDQLACALYMRDKLLPLATLMRGRAEIAPFTAPVAMIEPLNMVVYAFPIDGELPTLVGATDRQRMTEILAETLPEVLAGQLTIQDVHMVPVNYARRYRCVMRYEIECLAPGNKLQRREVYGKVATDTQGALIAPVIAALRERVLGNRNAYQFNIPRSLGFRPDLQLSLLEAIPGTPQINQLLKARLSGADLPAGELTLDQALDACAQIANALHRSNIGLGRRRTLDDDLTGLRKDIREVQRVAPELGAQFQTWLERIEFVRRGVRRAAAALLPRRLYLRPGDLRRPSRAGWWILIRSARPSRRSIWASSWRTCARRPTRPAKPPALALRRSACSWASISSTIYRGGRRADRGCRTAAHPGFGVRSRQPHAHGAAQLAAAQSHTA